MDIKTELLPANHTACFNDDYPVDKLVKLWNETENRLASIENMNLRSIILNTLDRRNVKINGISAE